jgi:hypothetical protein
MAPRTIHEAGSYDDSISFGWQGRYSTSHVLRRLCYVNVRWNADNRHRVVVPQLTISPHCLRGEFFKEITSEATVFYFILAKVRVMWIYSTFSY